MSKVQIIVGIILVALSGMYPLWAVYHLNKRLGRPEGPTTRQLMFWLAFTLSFPFALALTGAGLIARPLGLSPLYRGVVGGLWGFTLVAAIGYIWVKQ